MNPYLPHDAVIVDRVQESTTIFTLRLAFSDPVQQKRYAFAPGQFNMVYLHGVGEVAISIISDPERESLYDHTIRVVGRVTRGLAQLKKGDHLGIRGPFGRGWPLLEGEGRDVMIVTGGLGCAPVVAVINYILHRRERFGRLTIMQGVKHAEDLLWRSRYEAWARMPNTQVIIAADAAGKNWPWHVGRVTDLFDQVALDPGNTVAMMCGPEGMMRAVVGNLLGRGMSADDIYLSMERNMQCAVGHCGHCQFGPHFICKDGPVFSYREVQPLLGEAGF